MKSVEVLDKSIEICYHGNQAMIIFLKSVNYKRINTFFCETYKKLIKLFINKVVNLNLL